MRPALVVAPAAVLVLLAPSVLAAGPDATVTLVGPSQTTLGLKVQSSDVRFTLSVTGASVVRDLSLTGPGSCSHGTASNSAIVVGMSSTLFSWTCHQAKPGTTSVTLRLGQGALRGTLHVTGASWT